MPYTCTHTPPTGSSSSSCAARRSRCISAANKSKRPSCLCLRMAVHRITTMPASRSQSVSSLESKAAAARMHAWQLLMYGPKKLWKCLQLVCITRKITPAARMHACGRLRAQAAGRRRKADAGVRLARRRARAEMRAWRRVPMWMRACSSDVVGLEMWVCIRVDVDGAARYVYV